MKKTELDLYLQQGGQAEITENFRRLQRYADTRPQVDNFKPVSFSLQENGSQVKIAHGLSFVPKDAILTRLIAPSGAKLILHFGLFDRTNIVVSAAGLSSSSIKARLLVGSFENGNLVIEDALAETDTQEYESKV